MLEQTTRNIVLKPLEQDNTGLKIIDAIAQQQISLKTPELIHTNPVDKNEFPASVDRVVEFKTTSISANAPGILIRNSSNEMTDMIRESQEHFSNDLYKIEILAPIKIYMTVESEIEIDNRSEEIIIDFGERTKIMIGARSSPRRPATTLTTPADPERMMQVVSTFGSALKTYSAERSYPTLRGHPPAVKLGDELDLNGLTPPETGVTIEIPPTHRSVFVVTPLAYYLGARVVPGENPCIRTDTGFEYALDGAIGFERTVERTLKQILVLDCLTRTEGQYPVTLHERRELEPTLNLDFGELYGRPLKEQIETYLEIPYEKMADHIPKWKLTTYVDTNSQNVEILPYLTNELSIIRSGNVEIDLTTASIGPDARHMDESFSTEITSTGSIETAWVGQGILPKTSKLTVEGFENRIERDPTTDDISVTIICNDSSMIEEQTSIADIYGKETSYPFETTIEHNLTTNELETALAAHTDFLHYMGHVETDGFKCSDGTVDTATLDSVGVDAFLLNACQSYEQGLGLIEAGAIGGIVTLSDVLNGEAITMGKTIARLLNSGYDLYSATNIAHERSKMADRYTTLGDGGVTIAQTDSGIPILSHIQTTKNGYELTANPHPTTQSSMGTMMKPYAVSDEYYLLSKISPPSNLDEIENHITQGEGPFQIDSELSWDRNDINLR